jgi:hypothetical protein
MSKWAGLPSTFTVDKWLERIGRIPTAAFNISYRGAIRSSLLRLSSFAMSECDVEVAISLPFLLLASALNTISLESNLTSAASILPASISVDDATSVLHVPDRRLRRNKYRKHIDSQRPIEICEFEILEGTHNRDSRVVDENVYTAQLRHRAFDGGDHGACIGAVSLNGQGANPERLRCLDDFVRSVG